MNTIFTIFFRDDWHRWFLCNTQNHEERRILGVRLIENFSHDAEQVPFPCQCFSLTTLGQLGMFTTWRDTDLN